MMTKDLILDAQCSKLESESEVVGSTRKAQAAGFKFSARDSMFDVRCSMFGVFVPNGSRFKVCFAALLSFCILRSAFSITDDSSSSHPYQSIVDRNVFGLKPPPPPAPPPNPEANKPPPPNLTLTGITTILNQKRAFMSYTLAAKPPEPPKTMSLMLSEGQRDGDIEVMEIDIVNGTVKVNDFGTITNLSWEKNGIKTASSGGGGAAPGSTGIIPTPGQNPNNNGGSPFGQRTIPTRQLRLPGAAAAPAGSPSASAAPDIATPGGTLSFGSAAGQPTQAAAQQPGTAGLTEEAAATLLEVERERTKGDVLNGRGAPLPITQYTPRGSVGDASDESATTTPQPQATPNNKLNSLRRPGMPLLPQ